jgi:hypothetical protein
VNSSYLTMGTPFVNSHAFEGKLNGQVSSEMRGDTVFVTLGADEPIVLQDQTLVSLEFALNPQTPIGTAIPLSWVPLSASYNATPLANLGSGSLTATGVYGDATGDQQVTALDASYILQYVVGIRTTINKSAADVTGNSWVSSLDAAWVLLKTIYPETLFPCEGGAPLPGAKPAASAPVALKWERTDTGWSLVANDATGIMSGDLVLTFADDTPVNVSGDGMFAYRQDGRTLHVSFLRTATEGNALLSLTTPSDAPQSTEISLNEGSIPAALSARVPFSLAQNTPNPFNPSTTLHFSLPEAQHVRLAVYDVTGALTRTLVDRNVEAGMHEVVWDGRNTAGREVASGVYIYRLTGKQGVVTRRMTLLR